MTPVHPRLRGELALKAKGLKSLFGSSPLTRGTLSEPPPSVPPFAVHPRLRGELRIETSISQISNGSSPLTRGTLLTDELRNGSDRFIPAYAGNSPFGSLIPRDLTVHPRLRGELVYLNVMAGVPNGSSPLTRGTHDLSDAIAIFGRFIPAYAGNSFGFCFIASLCTVHPRLRGELKGWLLG